MMSNLVRALRVINAKFYSRNGSGGQYLQQLLLIKDIPKIASNLVIYGLNISNIVSWYCRATADHNKISEHYRYASLMMLEFDAKSEYTKKN